MCSTAATEPTHAGLVFDAAGNLYGTIILVPVSSYAKRRRKVATASAPHRFAAKAFPPLGLIFQMRRSSS